MQGQVLIIGNRILRNHRSLEVIRGATRYYCIFYPPTNFFLHILTVFKVGGKNGGRGHIKIIAQLERLFKLKFRGDSEIGSI